MNIFEHVDFSSVVTTCESNSDCLSCGLIVALDRSWLQVPTYEVEAVGTRSCVGQILRCGLFWYALLYVPETGRHCWLQLPSHSDASAPSARFRRRSTPCEFSTSVSKFVEKRRHQEESGVFSGRSMMSVFWSLFPRLRRS